MNIAKMIVMDLDGTLLNEKSRVSQQTKEYLGELKQNGYIIVIATGRILKSALIATDGADFANYIVTDAGAAVYKKQNEEWKEMYADLIPRKIAEDMIYEFNDDKFMYVDICSKNYIDMYATKHSYEEVFIRKYIDKNKILNNINEIIHISVAFWKNEFTREYKKIFSERYPELDVTIMQDSFDDFQWLEILKKGVSKYKGIFKISQIENIENKDIIAFGDGLNDIDMIEKCGVGVAMKNALPEVKEKSNFVTDKTNLEDGIIEFLAKFLTNN